MEILNKSTNQQGAISLYVSIAIMLIIMIIGMSFAHIMSNNYTDTTKRQLNLEAQYAAETGIFDGRKIVKAYFHSLYNTEQSYVYVPPPPRPPSVGGHVSFDGRIEEFSVNNPNVAVAKLPSSHAQTIQFTAPDEDQFKHCDKHGKLLDPGTSTEITVDWATWNKDFDCKYPRYVLTILDPNANSGKGHITTYIYDWTTENWEDKGNFSVQCTIGSTTYTETAEQISLFADDTGAYLGVMSPLSAAKETLIFAYELDSTFNWTVKVDNTSGNVCSPVVYLSAYPLTKVDSVYSFTLFRANSKLAAIVTGQNASGSSSDESYEPATIVWNNSGTLWGGHSWMYMPDIPIPPGTGLKMIPIIDPNNSSSPKFFDVGSKWLISVGDKIYVHTNNGGSGSWASIPTTYTPTTKSGEGFGVSMGAWGNLVVVGAEDSNIQDDGTAGSDATGLVYKYTLSGNSLGTEVIEIDDLRTNLLLADGDDFGQSVGFAKDVLAVGSDSKVYVFGPEKIPVISSGVPPTAPINRNLINIPPCINDQSDIPSSLTYIPEGENTPRQVKLDMQLDGDRVGYSCLDIEIDPDVLYWEQVSNSKSLNVILKPIVHDDPNLIREDNEQPRMKRLKIKWTYTDKNITKNRSSWSPSAGYPNLPDENGWDAKAPLLRVMITPFDADGFSREELLRYTKTYYFYPGGEAGQAPVRYDDPTTNRSTERKSGYIAEARCSNRKGGCVGVITGLPHYILEQDRNKDTVGTNKEDDVQFLVSISSFYGDADVELKGFRGRAVESAIWDEDIAQDPDIRNDDVTTGKRLKFKDIQAIIRATGYSTDIKVRLEERIPLQHPFFGTPYNTVNSATSLCKVLIGDPDVGTTTAGTISGGTILNNTDARHKYFFDTDALVNALSPGDPADVFDQCHAWPTP